MNADTHHEVLSRSAPGSGARAAQLVQTTGLLLVLAAVLFLFFPAIRSQFVYDDTAQIVLNKHIQSDGYLAVYFTQNVWSQIPNNETNLYRPLFLVWLRLNQVMFGEEPAGWHLTTVLLHVLATALVYCSARFVLDEPWLALIAALIFGVHPIHVESVAWVSGVTDPLSTAMFFGALLCYLQSRQRPLRRILWMAASLILFAAGILAKETAAVLPLVIAAYECTVGRSKHPSGKASWPIFLPKLCVRLAPYMAVFALYWAARSFAMHGELHRGPIPLHVALLSWPWLLWTYLKMLFWPAHLSPLYDFAYVDRLRDARFLVPLAGLLAAVGGVWQWTRRRESKLEMFLVLWFLITLAPAMASFCLASPAESYHDRYLYLPSVAFALLAGAAIGGLASHRSIVLKTLAAMLAIGLPMVLALSTHRQVRYWESDNVLFERAHAMAPQNELAASNFAAGLIKMRQYRQALELSQEMMRLHPESQAALNTAASASFLLHDYAMAERYYAQEVELDPGQPSFLYLLGVARMRQGKYVEALPALRRAVDLSPEAPFWHYTLGTTLGQLGQWQDARDQFLAELQISSQIQPQARVALADAENHVRAEQSAVRATHSMSRTPISN